MITHLLDTSVYSQRLQPRPVDSVMERWSNLGDSSLSISSICEAELVYGLEKKSSARLWKEYHQYLENRLIIFPIDTETSHCFATIKAETQKVGNTVADFDLLIAATAITRRLKLATLNYQHFEKVPRLDAEDWSTY